MKKRGSKIVALMLAMTMAAGVMTGCGSQKTETTADTGAAESTAAGTNDSDKKKFVFGDTP